MPAGRLAQSVQTTVARIGRRRTGVVVGALRGGEVSFGSAGETGHGAVPDEHTLFEIGSVTKVFTALLLADGVVRGEWALTTPVQELIPDVVLPQKSGTPITLQHLATHISGLPRSPKRFGLRENLDYLSRGADPYAGFAEPELLATLARTRLKRTPGTGPVHYSNFGYGLLGLALSRAAGLDYGTLVREQITEPLGLVDTLPESQASEGQRRRCAQGHRSRRRTAEPWPLLGLEGAGALRSTGADLAMFLRAQLDPGSTPLAEAIRLTHRTPAHGPRSMALGWHRGANGMLWHNGGTGGFRSIAAFRSHTHTAVWALINQSAGADLKSLRLLNRLSDH